MSEEDDIAQKFPVCRVERCRPRRPRPKTAKPHFPMTSHAEKLALRAV